jgi:hypothetical protein
MVVLILSLWSNKISWHLYAVYTIVSFIINVICQVVWNLFIMDEDKAPSSKPRHKWENNIKMKLKETEYEGANWVHMDRKRGHWRNTDLASSLPQSQKEGTKLYLCEISSSHGGEYEAQSPLGCTVVFLIGCRPTFQRSVLMMEAAHTSETSVDIQLRTRQYVPEDSEL